MDESRTTINIMTSCDSVIMHYVLVALQSISNNLRQQRVRFFLFHAQEDIVQAEWLQEQAGVFQNIEIQLITLADTSVYKQLANLGGWSWAAYCSVDAYRYLPSDMDRILYIDAADVFVAGDISPYYFADFEGNALLATSGRYKTGNGNDLLYRKEDLRNSVYLPEILRGVFNSGSYVMNLEKMRKLNYTGEYCLAYARELCNLANKEKDVYWGDQGFLSALFVGDIKFFGYPKIAHVYYMPYNFCLWFFDRYKVRPEYKAAIIHFAGAPKPWGVKYPVHVPRFSSATMPLMEISQLKAGQAEYYYLWHEYAIAVDQVVRSAPLLKDRDLFRLSGAMLSE